MNAVADPVAFAEDHLGFFAWSKQREILRAVADHDRVAVRSCNASGKTALAPAAVMHHLAQGPGSIAITTAPTERQVKKLLWREVHRRYKAARDLFDGATVTDTEILLAEDWFAVGVSTDNAESFQGWHGARVLVVIDEASGVDEVIWEAVEGVLAGGEARVLAISNPLRSSGSFYDAFNANRDEWELFTISAYDTPNLTGEQVPDDVAQRLVSRAWVEQIARRGQETNAYRVRVLGEFPSEQDDTVIAARDLDTAHGNDLEPGLPVVVTLDPARYGSDESAFAVRTGSHLRVVNTTHGFSLMETTGALVSLARQVQADTGVRPVVVVDANGIGAGVVDRLVELGEFKVVPFNSANKASRPREYPNRRSELWFDFAELLPLLDLDLADEELSRELLAPAYSFASDGSRVVEKKSDTRKKIRRSPDRADALLMTLVHDPPIAPGRARRRRGSIASPHRRRVPLRALTRPPLGTDRELAAAAGVHITSSRSAVDVRASLGTRPIAPQPSSRARVTGDIAAGRGRDLGELVAAVRMPADIVADVLADEVRRGHIALRGGRYFPTAKLEREYGFALRHFHL